ncbi:MAG: ankyrin repeat domain-containing protein [Methyloprofundus sp.]|nr:ankyrin repeat domain-containing protein [Methyloprofundus sp.]
MNIVDKLIDILDVNNSDILENLKQLSLDKLSWTINPFLIESNKMVASAILSRSEGKTASLKVEVIHLNGNQDGDKFYLSFSVQSKRMNGPSHPLTHYPYVCKINSPSDFDDFKDYGFLESLRSNSSLIIRAIKLGHLNRIEEMLNYGFDINAHGTITQSNSNLSRETFPLIASIEEESLDIAKTLLDKGALVEVKDKSGWSPIFHAVTSSRREFVTLLLDHGASPLVVDSKGRTPASIAKNREDIEILGLLQKKMKEMEEDSILGYKNEIESELNSNNARPSQ